MSTLISLEEIYAPVEKPLNEVPSTILSILGSSNTLAEEVIQYFFSGKGKLLRPALTLLGAAIQQGDKSTFDSKLIELASSYEIFHGATLIHDDIIDNAYVRRNLPTINEKWDAQTAVLVGDFLHDKAMGVIFKNGSREIFTHFLETAGLVCDGEIHELGEKGNASLSEKDYYEIIRKKTAVLLAACLQAGALYSGASSKEALKLYRFGLNFGLAFQIVDDCLDFTGSEHEFGKTLGTDVSEGVLTLPTIRLLEVATEEEKKEIGSIFNAKGEEGKLSYLLELIREYDTVQYSIEKAKEFNQKAIEELADFPQSAAKQSLEKLLDYVLERNR